MCGVLVLLGPTEVPQDMQSQPSTAQENPKPTSFHPILWRAHFLADIITDLIFRNNLTGTGMNSNLDLVGILIHFNFMADSFNVWECKTLAWADKTSGRWLHS